MSDGQVTDQVLRAIDTMSLRQEMLEKHVMNGLTTTVTTNKETLILLNERVTTILETEKRERAELLTKIRIWIAGAGVFFSILFFVLSQVFEALAK